MIVGLRSRRTTFVPRRTAGCAKVTSNEFPPVAIVTGELTPFISIWILETVKLTEYNIEPLGRLADAIV
jgi:hypothetical protein